MTVLLVNVIDHNRLISILILQTQSACCRLSEHIRVASLPNVNHARYPKTQVGLDATSQTFCSQRSRLQKRPGCDAESRRGSAGGEARGKVAVWINPTNTCARSLCSAAVSALHIVSPSHCRTHYLCGQLRETMNGSPGSKWITGTLVLR